MWVAPIFFNYLEGEFYMRVFIKSIEVNSMDMYGGDGDVIDISVINTTIKARVLDDNSDEHYIETKTSDNIQSFSDAERVIRRLIGNVF